MTKNNDQEPFWKTTPLAEMNLEQWDSLCDGCARCCLHKLEDMDSGVIDYTNVACRLLDIASCRCTNYVQRTFLIPDCVELTPDNLGALQWLPPTCAYRLIHEGKELYPWHPLVSGDPDSVHKAGISVRSRAVAEKRAGDLEDHIVTWPDENPSEDDL